MPGPSPKTITIVSKDGCSYCILARTFLRNLELPFEIEKLQPGSTSYGKRRTELIRATGHSTFPWIFVGTTFIGGYKELIHAYNTLRLEDLVAPLGLHINDT